MIKKILLFGSLALVVSTISMAQPGRHKKSGRYYRHVLKAATKQQRNSDYNSVEPQ